MGCTLSQKVVHSVTVVYPDVKHHQNSNDDFCCMKIIPMLQQPLHNLRLPQELVETLFVFCFFKLINNLT